jgi:YidC/Oxa1 family membrane protein insertase
VLVKVATYPLTRKQMASTIALQALQPRVKEIQERFKGRPPEEAQVEVARLYKEAGVNPLAGCLPTLVTLPVWIGLYRALSNVADEGLLKEGWFWIPSLAGPTSLAAQKAGAGTSWLFPFVDGAPPIGWSAAGAYLVLPVALIASQYITQKMMSPQSDDPAAQQSQAILKFLPLMIGWFSLNVPAGLTLYWFTNNLLSTAQQAYLKKTLGAPAVAGSGAGGSVSSSSPASSSSAAVQRGQEEAGPPRPSGELSFLCVFLVGATTHIFHSYPAPLSIQCGAFL